MISKKREWETNSIWGPEEEPWPIDSNANLSTGKGISMELILSDPLSCEETFSAMGNFQMKLKGTGS